MELTSMNIIIYLMSIFSGCFFCVMILTFIENKAQKFKDFTERVHSRISQNGWRGFTLAAFILAGIVIAFFTTLGASRGGILAGVLGGITVHFKAGVSTLVYNEADYKYPGRKNKMPKKK